MGGGRLIRFMILVLVVVLVWKVWDYSALPSIESPNFKTSQGESETQTKTKPTSPGKPKTDHLQMDEPMKILPPPDKGEDLAKKNETKIKEEEVKVKKEEVKEKKEEVKENKEEVKEKKEEVKEKKEEVKEKKEEVKEKDPQIQEKKEEVKEKDSQIQEKKEEVKAKEEDGKKSEIAKPAPEVVEKKKEIEVLPTLEVTVYYEALCPDSRHFVMKQLTPAFKKLNEYMKLYLVPYGKASTMEKNGDFVFDCQHGPVECQANMVHACVTNIVKDPTTQLSMVHCMIDNNRSPLTIGQKCSKKYGVSWKEVQACTTSQKGGSIMKHMGDMTHSLRPKVKFIPTITINGSQDGQTYILQDLHKVLCQKYKGSKPPTC